jgi:hypothetical protein
VHSDGHVSGNQAGRPLIRPLIELFEYREEVHAPTDPSPLINAPVLLHKVCPAHLCDVRDLTRCCASTGQTFSLSLSEGCSHGHNVSRRGVVIKPSKDRVSRLVADDRSDFV